MPGRSELRGAPGGFDAMARAAAGGALTRRSLLRRSMALGLATALPRLAFPARSRADVKFRGTCENTPPAGTCSGSSSPWTPSCQQVIPSGKPSSYNGCGPESGLDLPILGHGDFVPDIPLDLANFFNACKGHDCCYGTCQSDKAACDAAFLGGMVDACHARWGPSTQDMFEDLHLLFCISVAHAYHHAVATTQTGTEAYQAAQASACLCCDCQPDGDHSSDPKNCGQCGHECPPDWSCCGGQCVDTRSNPQNCGACGHACDSLQHCTDGVCTDCPDGRAQCGSICCPTGQSCCDGTCIDTSFDNHNCGACGKKCSDGETCSNGTCSHCQGDMVACGEYCCSPGQICCNGRCSGPCGDVGCCEPNFMARCCRVALNTYVCCDNNCQYTGLSGFGHCV